MIKARLWVCAALLSASTQGCGWFDTNPQAREQEQGAGARGGDGPNVNSGKAEDSGEPAESGAGEGGNAGAASGSSGVGGGLSGGGVGGAGGAGGSEPPDDAGQTIDASDPLDGSLEGGTDGGCDAGCSPDDRPTDFSRHPEPRRFAVTDESIDSGEQARVWLLAQDDDGSHRLLSLRLAVSDASAWIDTGIDDITTNPQGLSFVEDGVQQQRVFFVSEDILYMLTPNDLGGALPGPDGGPAEPLIRNVLSPPHEDLAFEGGDLAAVYVSSPEPHIALFVPATVQGVADSYCVFIITGPHATAQCIADPIVHDETDVQGAVVGDEVHFYLRTSANGLYRVARNAEGGYVGAMVSTPEGRAITSSIVGMASEVDGRVELIVVTDDGHLWTARPLATDRGHPDWTSLTPLSDGVLASTRAAATAAVVTENYARIPPTTTPVEYRRTELRVIGDDGQLYRSVTKPDEVARTWPAWERLDDVGHDQYALAIGAITQYRLYNLAALDELHQVANSLMVVGYDRATTLQEAPSYYHLVFWRDRLRMEGPASLPMGAPLAELSSAAGGDYAVVAAAVHSAQAPSHVELFGSFDGASTFHSVGVLPSHVEGAAHPMSVMQPSVRYANGTFHVTTLERALPQSCDGWGQVMDEPRRITYRRALDAPALARMRPNEESYFIVRDGTEYMGNPALALTEGASGTTAHVIYNAGPAGALAYWRQGPLLDSEPVEAWLTPPLIAGAPVLATGNDEALYAAASSNGQLMVCQIPPNGVMTAELCSAPSAQPDTRDLYFGGGLQQRFGECWGDAAPYFACLRDDRPFSIAVDTAKYIGPAAAEGELPSFEALDHRVLVAYAGADGPATSIYLTVSPGGAALGAWTVPIRINPRAPTDTSHSFDPEVTIDSRHRVTITYSALDAASEQGQVARAYIWQGELGRDGNVHYADVREAGVWYPEALPFDCVSQRAALGAYREPETVGARALHVVRTAEGHDTRWLSEYGRQ